MATKDNLRKIFEAGYPLIEQWLDAAEQIAALRDVATDAGLDWSQIKALLKAKVQDDRDDAGTGKRINRIVDKAESASAYADMLGLAKVNENINSAERYDRLVAAVKSAGPRVADVKAKLAEGESVDPETGEITESRAKADDEAAGTEREMPSVESVSRLDARRSASATSEIMDVTSRERPATNYTPLAQRSEPIAHNDLVAGSNPAGRTTNASMAESVDAADLKSAALKHEGSSPSAGTNDIGEIPPFLDRRSKARAAEMA